MSLHVSQCVTSTVQTNTSCYVYKLVGILAIFCNCMYLADISIFKSICCSSNTGNVLAVTVMLIVCEYCSAQCYPAAPNNWSISALNISEYKQMTVSL